MYGDSSYGSSSRGQPWMSHGAPPHYTYNPPTYSHYNPALYQSVGYEQSYFPQLEVPPNVHQTTGVDSTSSAVQRLATLVQDAHQIVVVLCGIPGSGKSTFCHNLIQRAATNSETIGRTCSWMTFNQDKLGSRKAVYNQALTAVQQGYHIVIDRCNFDQSQRSHWIELARNHARYSPTIVSIVMPDFDNVNLCADRAYRRGDSDGIHDIDTDWNGVCYRMAQEFVFPNSNEGFECVVQCNSDVEVHEIIDVLASSELRH
eukprot:gene5367-5903_t